MSTQHEQDGHEGLIRTPRQLIIVVILSFVVPVIGIVMLAKFVTGTKNVDPVGSSVNEAANVADRLRPVGTLWVAGDPAPAGAVPAAAAGPRVEKSGEEVYKLACAGCHSSGALNAPKMGDTAAWAKLIPEGLDMLTRTAISGIRQMPARGGNPSLTDLEMRRAVVYMANASGAKFKEPPAPAPAAAAAAAPVAVAAAAPAQPAAAAAPDGAAVYKQACAACHASGAAGAPKSGDKTAWAPRLRKGEDALVASVVKGLGVMPPRGGNPSLTDAQIRAAVRYQIETNR